MRDTTNKILEMIDEGLLDAKAVAQMCLKYMSEDAVADMADANEIFFDDEDVNEDFEEDEEPDCPYVVFAGKSCSEENPMSAWPTEDSAIEAGQVLLDSKFYNYVEVVFMPEDDDDINEVIWWGERPSQN